MYIWTYIAVMVSQIFLFIQPIVSQQMSGALYSTAQTPCVAVAMETSNVDFLCELSAPSELCDDQDVHIQWYYASPDLRLMISDSDKYGIWSETDPTDGDVINSALRVRNLRKDQDIGLYTCTMTCGSRIVSSERIELCVQNKATGLVLCNGVSNEETCSATFANGICDEQCDSSDRLFDGGDCDPYHSETCPIGLTMSCTVGHADGICDENCNSAQCGYDGGDCLGAIQLDDNEEFITLVAPSDSLTETFIQRLSFLLSMKLSTLVRQVGQLQEWSITHSGQVHVSYMNAPAFAQNGDSSMSMIKYALVPQSCGNAERCFRRASDAVKYLSNHLLNDPTFINSTVAALGVSGSSDMCQIQTDVKKPAASLGTTYTKARGPGINIREGTTPNDQSQLIGYGEIIGISLCGLALILLIIGIIFAYRYHMIAKKNTKSSITKQQKQSYFDNEVSVIHQGKDSPHLSPGPQDQQTSPGTRSRTRDYMMEDDCV